MKKLLVFITIISIVSACSPGDKNPQDIEGLEALVAEKKEAISSLEVEIDSLKAKIQRLEPNKEQAAVLISTMTLDKGNFKRFTTVQGSVEAKDKAYASSETGGRLLAINVSEGQYVNRGQLLARVDLKTLSDQKAEIQTSLDLAEDVLERQQRLWDQKIGTEIQYLQAKNNVERLQKSLATIESQIAKANIYAPISGVVENEMLEAGEFAAPGAPILEIINTKNLKVVADIPERYITSISKGDDVEIFFPALGDTLKGKVNLIGRVIDPSNRTFKVEVFTSNNNGNLKPNLLAELKFNDLAKEDVITVPLNVIQEEVNGNKYVYTVDKSGDKPRAKKTTVQIGEAYEGQVVINQGLKSGDQIIIDGAKTVANGDIVRDLSK